MTVRSLFHSALIVAVLSTGVVACTTATPYQPDIAGQRVSGGYSEQQLGEGRYRVNFAGNSLTSRDRVEGYLLYRAAELTVQNGYDWFLIVDRLTEMETQTYVRPDPFYRPYYGSSYGFWRPHWRYRRHGRWLDWHPEWGGPFWATSPEIVTTAEFEAHAEIVMRRGLVPESEERGFDARRVMTDLGPTIVRPEPNR